MLVTFNKKKYNRKNRTFLNKKEKFFYMPQHVVFIENMSMQPFKALKSKRLRDRKN